MRATGPNGAVGKILTGPAVKGLRCWRAEFSNGARQEGCMPTYPTGPWTNVESVQQKEHVLMEGPFGRRRDAHVNREQAAPR